MDRLDNLFKPKEKKNETEVLEELESRLNEGDFIGALNLVDSLENSGNIFLALRLILKGVSNAAKESTSDSDKATLLNVLKEAIPRINTIRSNRYRAVLLGELAKTFYRLGDDFNGDISLKTALNLASPYPDILRDILRGLIEEGMLNKAAYAFKMVKDKRALDPVLEYLVERLYHVGKIEQALEVLEHIESPFHRAIALYSLALLSRKNPTVAQRFLERAMEEAVKIDDPETRFELMLKLYDLRHEILGEPLSLSELLARETPREKGPEESQGPSKGEGSTES